jgi:hypothetical protein
MRFGLLGALLLTLACLSAAAAHAAITVVGNWEGGSGDGWIDWGNQQSITADVNKLDPDNGFYGQYNFSSTTGVTIGSSSVHVMSLVGADQDLSIKLQNTPLAGSPTGDERGAFFTNRAFAIDITYPAQSLSSGYQQLYEVALNTEHYGYHSQYGGTVPVPGTGVLYGAPTSDYTYTLVLNYSSYLDVNGGLIVTSGTPDGWVELIFATNADSNHLDYYFDNARLYTPGDMNNDGHVNAADIRAMELALTNPGSYQSTYFSGNANFVTSDLQTIGDTNGDGTFNNADLQALQSYLIAGHGNETSVPEPCSILLIGLAGPAGLWLAWRCQKITNM